MYSISFKEYLCNFLAFFQGTPGFRSHASRVALYINDGVQCLSKANYEEELEAMWTSLGESHNRRKISRQSFNVRFTIVCVWLQILMTLFLFESTGAAWCTRWITHCRVQLRWNSASCLECVLGHHLAYCVPETRKIELRIKVQCV